MSPRYRGLIAVIAYHLDGRRVTRWPDGGYGVPAPYLDAIRRAGGRAAIIAPGEEGDPGEILGPFDGLLLVGGGDVDPAAYGAQPDVAHNYGVEADRDAFEIALLRAADRMHLPALCICRGMQVMNVAYGGTLHQHLPDEPGLLEHGVPLEGTQTLHEVEPEPGTLLSATTKPGRALRCASHHHQGVDRLGEGLLVAGRSADGLVEAIAREGADLNRPSTWMLGVQWHPEETAAADPSQQRLFDALVTIASFEGQTRHGSGSKPFVVVEPDLAWPSMFDEEARRIQEVLPADLATRIEHVGSTSVPGLPAKPVIDIQLSVAAMAPVAAYADPLARIGYDHRVDPWNDDHEFFSRQDPDVYGGVNLHVCLAGSAWERGHLAFRDWLRAHPDDVRTYGDLKRDLAREHPRDIVAYLAGKTDFIEDLTQAALREV